MTTAFCFDLDGVITAHEILPILAVEVGFHEEMIALTDATINGVIPFERSFRLRCKILSDIPISRVRSIVSSVALHAKIVKFIQSHENQSFIITGNLDVWISDLVHQVGAKCFSSLGDSDADRLVGVKSVLNKGEVVDGLRDRFDRIVAVGDGMGDISMFERSDLRVAFGAVHNPVEGLIQLSDMLCFSEEALCQTLSTL